ncbi:hypothetical protein HK098_002137 [Nowakowskiella sp. JEL0407]|nr:hypothetical protein HK098_002137 [Nowakowskiella sp. JEL0407]
MVPDENGVLKSPERLEFESTPLESPLHPILKRKLEKSERMWERLDYIIDLEKRRYKYKELELKPKTVPTTTILIVGYVVVFIAMCVKGNGFVSPSVNPLFGPNFEIMVEFGGSVSPWILGDLKKNWWRLITANFLHSGIIHLLINVSADSILLPKTDRWYGLNRMGPVHFTTMLGAQIAGVLFRKKLIVAVGASGVICGTFGAMLAENVMNWESINKPAGQFIYWGVQLVLVLLTGLAPFVDNIVHIGGLLTGIAAGLLFLPIYGNRPIPVYFAIRLLGLILTTIILCGGAYALICRHWLYHPYICYFFLSIDC